MSSRGHWVKITGLSRDVIAVRRRTRGEDSPTFVGHSSFKLRPRQNGRHFADDTFKRIFMNENVRISINISLKFVPKGLINNIPALVQIMAWRRPGDKPLSEPMMVNLLTHICVTRPHWVNTLRPGQQCRRFADDSFYFIFLYEDCYILIQISLK